MEVEIGRGKKARRAYGFDDIAIVPSRRTRDPDDVDISWTLGPYRFELPLLASAMDGVVSPQTATIVGRLGGLAVLNLEGIFTRYEDADEMLERIAQLPKEEATREMQRDLPGARQAGADRPADRGDQGLRRRHRRVADPAEGARVPRDRAGRRAGHPGHPGHGRVGRARVERPDAPAAEPQGVLRRAARPGRGRRLRELPHRPAPDAHRRRRRARRRRPRRGVHHARRARHRRPAGDRDRRRGRRPLAAHARDGRVREGHRRRRHAQRRRRRQGDRLRRGRRDDRLAAGARLRGARPRLPLGHGDLPPDAPARRARADGAERVARGDRRSAPRTRTTARST